MSRFNVSTTFSALDHMTAPIRAISNAVRGLTTQIHTSNSTLNQFGHNTSISSLNTRVQALRRNFRGLTSDISSAGSRLTAIGTLGTIGGAMALNSSLDPIRQKESVQGSLGIEYTKTNTKMTPAERMKVGQLQYEKTAAMAPMLPGSVVNLGLLRSLMHVKGVEGNIDNITGLTNMLTGMGEGTLTNEAVSAFRSTLTANQSDLIERVGLKLITKKGMHGYKKDDGSEILFKNVTDQLNYLILWGKTKFPDATKIAMASTAGVESNAGDAKDNAIVSMWDNTGALTLYKEKVQELTNILTNATPEATKFVKSVADLSKEYPNVTNAILVGIPSLAALGLGLKALSFALSPFQILIPAFTWLLAPLAPAFTAATAGLTAFLAPVLAIAAPLILATAAIAGLVAGLLYLHNKLKEEFKDSWWFKPMVGNNSDRAKEATKYIRSEEAESLLGQNIANATQLAVDRFLNRNIQQTEKSSVVINIDPVTGQTRTQIMGSKFDKPKVNTGNNTYRAQGNMNYGLVQ